MAELNCYNKGCGKKFIQEENNEDSCVYHPGAPVFHDAYKGWSCCKKRSTDFTEFLNIPGCTKGKHDPNKPEPVQKKIEKPLEIGEVIGEVQEQMKNILPTATIERPSDDITKTKLEYTVASSLKLSLKKHKERQEAQLKLHIDGDGTDTVLPGAPCKHNTCDNKYVNENSINSECTYHPGNAIFHEGYKFWTCCGKRTTDFKEFLKQVGCEVGKHEWMKPSEIAEKKSNCRYDWHQTGSNVLISIYAKVCDPERCFVEANPTGVHAVLAFNGGTNVFELDLKLHGVVVPEKSCVEYLGTKVEIKLRKQEAFSWQKLEFVSN